MSNADQHHHDKMMGYALILSIAVIVTVFALMWLASSAHADVQGDACEAMGVKRCPKELPTVLVGQNELTLINKLKGGGEEQLGGLFADGVIYMNADLPLDRCYGKQFEFHERVHSLQSSSMSHDDKEAQAYRLQREFYVKCMEGLHE